MGRADFFVLLAPFIASPFILIAAFIVRTVKIEYVYERLGQVEVYPFQGASFALILTGLGLIVFGYFRLFHKLAVAYGQGKGLGVFLASAGSLLLFFHNVATVVKDPTYGFPCIARSCPPFLSGHLTLIAASVIFLAAGSIILILGIWLVQGRPQKYVFIVEIMPFLAAFFLFLVADTFWGNPDVFLPFANAFLGVGVALNIAIHIRRQYSYISTSGFQSFIGILLALIGLGLFFLTWVEGSGASYYYGNRCLADGIASHCKPFLLEYGSSLAIALGEFTIGCVMLYGGVWLIQDRPRKLLLAAEVTPFAATIGLVAIVITIWFYSDILVPLALIFFLAGLVLNLALLFRRHE